MQTFNFAIESFDFKLLSYKTYITQQSRKHPSKQLVLSSN